MTKVYLSYSIIICCTNPFNKDVKLLCRALSARCVLCIAHQTVFFSNGRESDDYTLEIFFNYFQLIGNKTMDSLMSSKNYAMRPRSDGHLINFLSSRGTIIFWKKILVNNDSRYGCTLSKSGNKIILICNLSHNYNDILLIGRCKKVSFND